MSHFKVRKSSQQGLEGQLDWIQAQLQANVTPKVKPKHKVPSLQMEDRINQSNKGKSYESNKKIHPLLKVNLEETSLPKPRQADVSEINLKEYNDTQILLAKVDAALKGRDSRLDLEESQEEGIEALLKKVEEVLSEPFTMVGALPLAQPKLHPESKSHPTRSQQQQTTHSKTIAKGNSLDAANTIQRKEVSQIGAYDCQRVSLPSTSEFRQPLNLNHDNNRLNRKSSQQPKLAYLYENKRQSSPEVDLPVFTYADQQRLRRLREMRNRQ